MEPINWHTFFFFLFAAAACAFALAVVLSNNIVRMALYLIMSLGAASGLFFLAGADFVGAMQLLIYVGGTLVLLIFGVMLTAQSPFISLRTNSGDWIVAVLLSGCLMALLVPAAFSVPGWRNQRPVADAAVDAHAAHAPERATTRAQTRLASAATVAANAADVAVGDRDPRGFVDANGDGVPDVQTRTATPLGMGLVGARVDKLGLPEEQQSGMSGYLLPFEVISVHLLVVLVGAAYLARTKRRAKRD